LLWPASISRADLCGFDANDDVVAAARCDEPAPDRQIISAPKMISFVPLPIEFWNATSPSTTTAAPAPPSPSSSKP
jgi:hypothetical protein